MTGSDSRVSVNLQKGPEHRLLSGWEGESLQEADWREMPAKGVPEPIPLSAD